MSKIKDYLRRKNYKLLEFFRRKLDAPLDAEWSWVIDQLFTKIAWLKQPDEGKTEISKLVVEGVRTGRLYWMEVILSSIIATFGLIQGSVAVIIGAMLIAPLLRPIQAMAFAIANGRHGLFWRSFKVLFLSISLGALLGFVLSFYLPIVIENTEILSRTKPNLLDFFIAVASAMIAFLALSNKRLYASVAGVAMATALMPPISVIGIELFLGNFMAAWGAFILLFTNLASILMVGALMFIFYGFNPHEVNTKETVRSLLVLISIVIVLMFTLGKSLQQIRDNLDFKKEINHLVTDELSQSIPSAKLTNLMVKGTVKSQKIKLTGNVQLPENIPFYRDKIDQLAEVLSTHLGKSVGLDLSIDRVASIQSDTNAPQMDDQLIKKTRFFFKQKFPEGLIVTQEALELLKNKWSVKTVYTLKKGVFMDKKTQDFIEQNVRQAFPQKEIKFIWGDLPTRELPTIPKKPTEDEIWFSEIEQRWAQFFEDNTSDKFSIENLDIRWTSEEGQKRVFVNFDLMVPEHITEEDLQLFNKKVNAFITTFNKEDIVVKSRIFPYFSLDISPLKPIKEEAVSMEPNGSDLEEKTEPQSSL